MQFRFSGGGHMRKMRRPIQYDEVTFGVQAKGSTADFRDADGGLDLATDVVTRVTGTATSVAATVAKDCSSLEV